VSINKQLITEMTALGYTIHRDSGKHLIWRHPDAATLVTTSRTPSDHRAVKNALSDAKRALRVTAGQPT
jgi:predicted RNA binding protein YcfA (HicA-like mRNA interferase family)